MVRVAGTSHLKLTYKAFTNWLCNQVWHRRSQFRRYLLRGSWKITAACFQVVDTEANHRLSTHSRPCLRLPAARLRQDSKWPKCCSGLAVLIPRMGWGLGRTAVTMAMPAPASPPLWRKQVPGHTCSLVTPVQTCCKSQALPMAQSSAGKGA